MAWALAAMSTTSLFAELKVACLRVVVSEELMSPVASLYATV